MYTSRKRWYPMMRHKISGVQTGEVIYHLVPMKIAWEWVFYPQLVETQDNTMSSEDTTNKIRPDKREWTEGDQDVRIPPTAFTWLQIASCRWDIIIIVKSGILVVGKDHTGNLIIRDSAPSIGLKLHIGWPNTRDYFHSSWWMIVLHM